MWGGLSNYYSRMMMHWVQNMHICHMGRQRAERAIVPIVQTRFLSFSLGELSLDIRHLTLLSFMSHVTRIDNSISAHDQFD